MNNESPGHVILSTNESGGEQLPPGGQRKLPAISGRQFKHGRPAGVRGREGSVQRGFCDKATKEVKERLLAIGVTRGLRWSAPLEAP